MTIASLNEKSERTLTLVEDSIREPFLKMSAGTLTVRTPWWPIVIKLGALGMIFAMMICGGMLIASQRQEMTGQAFITWQEAAIAGILAFTSLVLHENGHAFAARFTGRKVLWLQFGFAGGAVTSGNSTPLRRMIGIAAGPLTEIIFGASLLIAGGGHWDNPLGAAGFMALLNGIGNALPLHKTMDGYKFLAFLKLALRGNEPLVCAAEGPCPACAGATLPAPVLTLVPAAESQLAVAA